MRRNRDRVRVMKRDCMNSQKGACLMGSEDEWIECQERERDRVREMKRASL